MFAKSFVVVKQMDEKNAVRLLDYIEEEQKWNSIIGLINNGSIKIEYNG